MASIRVFDRVQLRSGVRYYTEKHPYPGGLVVKTPFEIQVHMVVPSNQLSDATLGDVVAWYGPEGDALTWTRSADVDVIDVRENRDYP